MLDDVTTHTLLVLVHALAALVFVNRYIGGPMLKLFRGHRWDQTTDDYIPTVTVVIPLFNEGKAVQETLQSVLDSDYPAGLLKVVCVDDSSSDDSYAEACEIARRDSRLTVLRNAVNIGKRESINHAVRLATSEIIVSVDSDVVVDASAIRESCGDSRARGSPRSAAGSMFATSTTTGSLECRS